MLQLASADHQPLNIQYLTLIPHFSNRRGLNIKHSTAPAHRNTGYLQPNVGQRGADGPRGVWSERGYITDIKYPKYLQWR